MEITSLRPQVMREGEQSTMTMTGQLNPSLYEKQVVTLGAQLGLSQQSSATQAGLFEQVRDMADAAIQGVLNFMRFATTIFVPPPPPQPPPPAPSPSSGNAALIPPPASSATSEAPATLVSLQPPAQPTPTVSQSLIPSWAEIFKLTGDCEFRPGGASNNAYIDFREGLKGKIKTLEVLSPDGTKVLATGKFEGITKEGKPRYRVNAKGDDLPQGAIIKATLNDTPEGNAGGVRYIEIPKPGQKFVW